MSSFNLQHAWRQLGAYFESLADRFGPAWSLMEERFTLRARRTLRDWIEAGEAAFRQLLLLEAQKLPAPAPQPSRPRGERSAPRQQAREISERALGIEAAPLFRLLPRTSAIIAHDLKRPPQRNSEAPKPRRSPTRVLARRLAALQEAFNDVETQVYRMVRALARNAEAAMAIFIDRPDPLRLPRDLAEALHSETRRVLTAAAADTS